MGKAAICEHNNGNSSVNQCINIGDQYGTTLFRKSIVNTHNTFRHKSYNRRKQASHEQSL